MTNFPSIAFGPAGIKSSSLCEKDYINLLLSAFEIGYRFIDFAHVYQNEDLIGESIYLSGIPRDEFILTGRISNTCQRNKEIEKEVYEILKNFKTDYIDILQFHWPYPYFYIQSWKVMENLKKCGIVKHIGVSNCNIHQLKTLIENCNFLPEFSQFERHPLFVQKNLTEFCQNKQIIVQSYTPFARHNVELKNSEIIQNLQRKYNKSFEQIIIKWNIQQNIIPIIRSYSVEHLKADFDIGNFNLSNDEILQIDSLNINLRLGFDSANCDYKKLR